MPLPLFLTGGLAVATATGIKKGLDGHQDKEKADYTLQFAQEIFKQSEQQLNTAQTEHIASLEKLGRLYLKIGNDFNKLQTLAKPLIEQIEKDGNHSLSISAMTQVKIESIGFNSATFDNKMVEGTVSDVAGMLAGYAIYGGVISMIAPISIISSGLSSAVAYNTILTIISGGAIASGGLGMAVGTKILSGTGIGLIAAPAIAGFAYASRSKDALEKARQILNEVQEYQTKVDNIEQRLKATKQYIHAVKHQVSIIYSQFQEYLDDLKLVEMMVRRGQQGMLVGQSDMLRMVENGYGLAAILTDIITTPLFHIRKTRLGDPKLSENGEPLLCEDEFGVHYTNHNQMNKILNEATQRLDSLQK